MEIQEQGIIGGRNAVIEVLRSGRIPDTVYIAEGEQHGSIGKVKALCRGGWRCCQDGEPQKA